MLSYRSFPLWGTGSHTYLSFPTMGDRLTHIPLLSHYGGQAHTHTSPFPLWGTSSYTYLSFPTMGDRLIITDASADLTCWFVSVASCCMHGMICVKMASCLYSSPRLEQKSAETASMLRTDTCYNTDTPS